MSPYENSGNRNLYLLLAGGEECELPWRNVRVTAAGECVNSLELRVVPDLDATEVKEFMI
jgi:hypothetical protein